MKNVFFVDQTRTAYNNGRKITFTKGEVINFKKLQRAGYTKAPTWMTELDPLAAKLILNNRDVDDKNTKEFNFSAEDTEQISKITKILIEDGFDRSDFAFGLHASDIFKEEGKETVWVIVKAEDENGILIGHNNKPVSLVRNNCVTASTFLSRFDSGKAIFARDF